METKVILISGKAGCGKDTLGKALKKVYIAKGVPDEKIRIVHFADLLKYIAREYFEWDGVKDEIGRDILQNIGTDVIRAKEPDFWVDFIKKMLTLFEGYWDYVIIPDARFPNEISKMRESFPTISIRVERDFDTCLNKDQLAHASETALDDEEFDLYFKNNFDNISDLQKYAFEEFIYEIERYFRLKAE